MDDPIIRINLARGPLYDIIYTKYESSGASGSQTRILKTAFL